MMLFQDGRKEIKKDDPENKGGVLIRVKGTNPPRAQAATVRIWLTLTVIKRQ